jgi:hypothetical protein
MSSSTNHIGDFIVTPDGMVEDRGDPVFFVGSHGTVVEIPPDADEEKVEELREFTISVDEQQKLDALVAEKAAEIVTHMNHIQRWLDEGVPFPWEK